MGSGRYVFDTNVVVSALLFPDSKPGTAFRFALAKASVLVSSETLRELDDVLRARSSSPTFAEKKGSFS